MKPVLSKEHSYVENELSLIAFAGSRYFIYQPTPQSACIWDLDRRTEHGRIEELGDVWAISSSHDGTLSACLSRVEDTSVIKLWSMESCLIKAKINRNVPGDCGTSLCLLEGGKAVLGTSTGQVEVWDLNRGQYEATAQHSVMQDGHSARVYLIKSASFAPSMVLTGSEDETLRLWDLRSNSCVRSMGADRDVLTGVSDMDAGAKVVICVGRNNDGNASMNLWDLGSGRCTAMFDSDASAEYNPLLTMHEGGEAFLSHEMSSSTEAVIKVWRTSDTSQPVKKSTLPWGDSSTFNNQFAASCNLSNIGLTRVFDDGLDRFVVKANVWA